MIGRGFKSAAGVAIVTTLLGALSSGAKAGTTGKLSGRVLDPAKQPIAGANVAIPLARTGAITEILE